MMKQAETHPVISAIRPEVEQTANDYGYELVQITFGGRGSGRVISVFIDKPGGVTADDCQDMAERLSLLLDAMDPLDGPYHLVVSSPGVERPLLSAGDFVRFSGRQAAVTDIDGEEKRTREGTLLGVEDGHVLLQTAKGETRIPLDAVQSAHLLYDFDDDLLA